MHASVYVFAGYFVYQFSSVWGWPLLLSIPVSLLLAGLIGMLVELVVYSPIRKTGAKGMTMLLSSFGGYVILQNLILLIWKSDPRTVQIPEVLHQGILLGYLTVTPMEIIIVITTIAAIGCILLFMRYTKIGKAVRAVENDEVGASIVGVPIQRIRYVCFFLGSALVALAAAFIVMDRGLEPTIGISAVLVATVAMIVGGVGSYLGAALAGFIIGIAENVGIWQISSEWKSTITFGVLIVFILFRPRGLFGYRLTRYEGKG
jgi:branched-subunit amino acid ABC-type transport system permease component